MNHRPGYFYQFEKDLLDKDLYHLLLDLDPRTLPVTTKLNRFTVIKSLVTNTEAWNLWSFISNYGLFGQKIATLLNLRLPTDLESLVLGNIKEHIESKEIPIVRMQIVFGGSRVPLHIDPTRTASLIIPLANHGGSVTRFYHSKISSPGLIDPKDADLAEQINIDDPTLLNTKLAHDVECARSFSMSASRTSLTVKWAHTGFNQLVRQIL